jgi:hypothetical protein
LENDCLTLKWPLCSETQQHNEKEFRLQRKLLNQQPRRRRRRRIGKPTVWVFFFLMTENKHTTKKTIFFLGNLFAKKYLVAENCA